MELTTDGLFFTLGNMMPPLRDSGFDVLVFVLGGIVFDCIVVVALDPVVGEVLEVDDDVGPDGE